jgi:Ca2+-binding RTX toxin-like protein
MTGWACGFSAAGFEVTGAGGADRIMGVEGRNILKGMGGDDLIIGRDGDDRLYGGRGNDTLLGMDGADRLFGGKGDDLLVSRVQDDINYTDPGVHKLVGGGGADTLLGGDGADVMRGGSGWDWLEGGHGNDTLQGGKGTDILTGGSGADVFKFAPASDGQRDKVQDFLYYSDSLAFTGATLQRDDFTTESRGGGARTLLTIDDGADIHFEIMFLDTPVSDVNGYLDSYNDFA